MGRVIVLLGKENNTEFYGLLTGLNYISTTYQTGSRQEFMDEVSDTFAQKILEGTESQSVGIMNGLRIYSSNKPLKIERLESDIADQFSKMLSARLHSLARHKALIVPASVGNN